MQDVITKEMSSEAFGLFEDFIMSVKDSIGEHYMTSNFHDLYHLPKIALKTGPIQSFSGFNFEHVNGLFARLCHGNKRFDLQIANKVESLISMQNFVNDETEIPNNNFISNLFIGNKWKSTLKVSDNLFLCGKIKKIENHYTVQDFDFYEPEAHFLKLSEQC